MFNVEMMSQCCRIRKKKKKKKIVIAAKNIENTSLSIHYYNVKADFLLFFPEAFIIITSASALYRQLKAHYYELYGY